MLHANFGSVFTDNRAAAKAAMLIKLSTLSPTQRDALARTHGELPEAQILALPDDQEARYRGELDAFAILRDPIGNPGPNRNALLLSPAYDWRGVAAAPGVNARAGADFGARFSDDQPVTEDQINTFLVAKGLTRSDYEAAWHFMRDFYRMKEVYHNSCTLKGRAVCGAATAVSALPGIGQIQNYGTKLLDYVEKKSLSEEEYKAAARGYIEAQDSYAMWIRRICDCTWANRAEDARAMAVAYGFNDFNNAMAIMVASGTRKDKQGGKVVDAPRAFNQALIPSRTNATNAAAKYPANSLARFNKTKGTWTIYVQDPSLHGLFTNIPSVFPAPPAGFIRAGEELVKPSTAADAGTEVERHWYHNPLPWIGIAGAAVATGLTVRKIRHRKR